jgi:hypothetical protein
MHVVRLAIISITLLFLLVTGISLFIPSHVRISKAVNIKAERDSIMLQLGDPPRWKNWYPGMDTAKLLYEGGMVKGVMPDEQSQTAVVVTQRSADEVVTEFTGYKMKRVVSGWKMIGAPGSDSVTVQWYMDFYLRWYPWEKFSSLLLEKSYGPKMEQGLFNLKKQVEN